MAIPKARLAIYAPDSQGVLTAMDGVLSVNITQSYRINDFLTVVIKRLKQDGGEDFESNMGALVPSRRLVTIFFRSVGVNDTDARELGSVTLALKSVEISRSPEGFTEYQWTLKPAIYDNKRTLNNLLDTAGFPIGTNLFHALAQAGSFLTDATRAAAMAASIPIGNYAGYIANRKQDVANAPNLADKQRLYDSLGYRATIADNAIQAYSPAFPGESSISPRALAVVRSYESGSLKLSYNAIPGDYAYTRYTGRVQTPTHKIEVGFEVTQTASGVQPSADADTDRNVELGDSWGSISHIYIDAILRAGAAAMQEVAFSISPVTLDLYNAVPSSAPNIDPGGTAERLAQSPFFLPTNTIVKIPELAGWGIINTLTTRLDFLELLRNGDLEAGRAAHTIQGQLLPTGVETL